MTKQIDIMTAESFEQSVDVFNQGVAFDANAKACRYEIFRHVLTTGYCIVDAVAKENNIETYGDKLRRAVDWPKSEKTGNPLGYNNPLVLATENGQFYNKLRQFFAVVEVTAKGAITKTSRKRDGESITLAKIKADKVNDSNAKALVSAGLAFMPKVETETETGNAETGNAETGNAETGDGNANPTKGMPTVDDIRKSLRIVSELLPHHAAILETIAKEYNDIIADND